jgi:spore coat protein CotH
MIRILTIRLLLLCTPLSLLGQTDLYDLNHIVEINIDFAEDNWHPLLDSLKEAGHDERLVADVTVDGTAYPATGIRYKGNSSYFNVRNNDGRKLPFNLKVNFVNKKTRLPGGFTTMKLSNVFRDPSFLREVMAYEIAGKYMPAPRSNFARVSVNGEYLGLYNLTESVDDDLLEKFFGDDDGILVKCDPNWHNQPPSSCRQGNHASLEYLGPDSICYYSLYELKSKHGWQALIELTKTINHEPERLLEVMNIDEALWMLAFDNVTVNLDSYIGRLCHNYYLYQDEQQVWHPIVWDMNLCFGGFRYTGQGAPLTNEGMQEMSMFLHFKEDNDQRPLVVQLLKNDHFRKIYLAHIRTLVEENFSNGWYKEKAEAIRSLIAEEVSQDPNKLYDEAGFEQNLNTTVQVDKSNIIGLYELMDARADYILSHPLMQKTPPTIGEVKHQTEGEMATIEATVTDALTVWVYYRPKPYAPWQRLALTAMGGEQWAGEVPLSNGLQYYLVAENDRTAMLSPRRASKEFYEVVVK